MQSMCKRRVESGAAIYFEAVIKYLCTELLKFAGDIANKDDGIIRLSHLMLAINTYEVPKKSKANKVKNKP